MLKFALVRPSDAPDVRPGLPVRAGAARRRPSRFDLRGSCGHSILSAVVVAERAGMLARSSVPATGSGCTSCNNGDSVVCEIDAVGRDKAPFDRLLRPVQRRYRSRELLMTGEPRTAVEADGRLVPGLAGVGRQRRTRSWTRRDAGRPGPRRAVPAGSDLFERMGRIRARGCRTGWAGPPDGAFPKIAAMHAGGGRAGSPPGRSRCPRWHPTIALTGRGLSRRGRSGSPAPCPGSWRRNWAAPAASSTSSPPAASTAVTATAHDERRRAGAHLGRRRTQTGHIPGLVPYSSRSAQLHFEEITAMPGTVSGVRVRARGSRPTCGRGCASRPSRTALTGATGPTRRSGRTARVGSARHGGSRRVRRARAATRPRSTGSSSELATASTPRCPSWPSSISR